MLPLSGTNLKIYGNNVIKWSNDYKHTRYFSNRSEQNSWFANKTTILNYSEFNVIKMDTGGQLGIKLPVSYNNLVLGTYLTFNDLNYGGKTYYCFINKIEMLNKGNTMLYIEIDMYQTFYLDVGWMPSYIEREHEQEYSNGLPVINTINEGLDYGTMYDTLTVEQVKPSGDVLFLVVACKQVAHNNVDLIGKIEPVVNGSPQPLTFYIHPFKRDGSNPPCSPSQVATAKDFLTALYTQEPAINNVVSITVTDYIGMDLGDENLITFPTDNFQAVTIQGQSDAVNTYYLKSMPSYSTKTISLGSKYKNLNTTLPSKLYMSPYYKIFLTDFQGNEIEVKAEYINSPNLAVTVKGSIGTNNKVSYNIANYNYNSLEPNYDQYVLNHSLINQNPNDVPIITDMLAAYLQGNRNSLINQENTIAFNGIANAVTSGAGVISSATQRDIAGASANLVNLGTGAGNTILQLQGIQAKLKDIDNTPPSISNMGGNNFFTVGNGVRGVYVVHKMVKEEYRNTLRDFFKRYGYKTNLTKIPNLNTRDAFNFVKTIEATLQGGVNNEVRVKLQTIFNNGITLWHTDDIGNYNLTNGGN